MRRAGTQCSDENASSGDESSDADCSSGGYTSGAINTDDDPGSLDLRYEYDKLPQTVIFYAKARPKDAVTPMMLSSPGSGYSIEDFASCQHCFPKQQLPVN